jgi:hypothetical protein
VRILALLLFLAGPVLAAPSISNVSTSGGWVGDGTVLDITGSSFGSNADNGPMLWGDFESGTSGQSIDNDSPNITAGDLSGYTNWAMDYSGNGASQDVVFNTTNPMPNSTQHARAVFDDSGDHWSIAVKVSGLNLDATGDEIYYSFYWKYNKTDTQFGRQAKLFEHFSSSPTSDEYYYSGALNNTVDNCEEGKIITHVTDTGPDEEQLVSSRELQYEVQWDRHEGYLKQSTVSTSDGEWGARLYRNGHDPQTVHDVGWGVGKTMRDNTWTDNFTLFGAAYYDGTCTPNEYSATIDMDNLYIDDTQARVEICDATPWSSRLACDLAIPTSWSDSAITVTYKEQSLGTCSASNEQYVYVIDSSGSISGSYALDGNGVCSEGASSVDKGVSFSYFREIALIIGTGLLLTVGLAWGIGGRRGHA